MARIAQGDAAALGELYDRYGRTVFGVLYRLLGMPEPAEEVAQDAFHAVWRRAGTYRPDRGSVRTWLLAIARNAAIDWRRAAKGPMLADESAAAEVPDARPIASEMLATAQSQARIFACLEALDDRPRTAIRAAFFDGLSYPQLAVQMAVPLGTMKSWVRRGLLQLKACIGDE